MKRFPNTSTIRYQLQRVFVAAMLAVAVLALLGKAAHAQPCGEIESAPEAVFFMMDELVSGLFPLSDAQCEKIVKTAVAACHDAVADTLRCTLSSLKSASKARKVACSELEPPDRDDCNDTLADFLDDIELDLELEAQDADAVCDNLFADSISDSCLGILPK